MLAMPRMLRELYTQPELGLMSHEMWFSRTLILVQYWRNLDSLLAYAKAKDAQHLPAWQTFNQAIGTDGSVGIWHETYTAKAGTYENVYANMPPFGLGKAGTLVEARSGLKSAVKAANPSLYFGLSLGVTFPLNILFGIPIYTAAAQRVLG